MTDRQLGYRARRLSLVCLWLAALVALGLIAGACGSESVEEGSPLTGTVTYRERVALPGDAVVTVQILDVSRKDDPAKVLGEQVIHTSGLQVPIPYEVPYDQGAIIESRDYSLFARIEDGERKLLFISDTGVQVITQDYPTKNVEIIVFPADSP